ncbi:unnamed protein product [Microthlaspi erraticum]|uniref:Uncharacterized protein n=1 Tax=Microthlaspi erraticum TaxID=1685480 RepID=A0A6D2J6X4_9BRAS|nr:unnamed protein product [Microthlaspi erraticum]
MGIIIVFSSLVSSPPCLPLGSADDERLVVGDVGERIVFNVTPRLEVKGSPGLNQEITYQYARIHIHGYQRYLLMYKDYTHSLKLNFEASAAGKTSKIHICCSLAVSPEVGMCPHHLWKEAINGSWTARMSPFDYKICDVRVVSSSANVTLEVSSVVESLMYRPLFLIIGTILLLWASPLSRSFAFYCTCSFTVGLILVFLLLLFQIIKLLPTRRRFLAFFIYSSLVGVTYVILPHIPGFFQGVPRALGFDDESNVLCWLLCLQFIGIHWGFLAMHSPLLKAQDGSIDNSTSVFISWCISIMSALLILQSSEDLLLAGGALIFVIVMSPILRRITILIFPQQIVMYLLLRTRNGIRYAVGQNGWAMILDFMFYRTP